MKDTQVLSDILNALERATGGIEATWITSQGVKLFKVDLTGIVDDERRIPKYLKMRKAQR